MRNEKKNHRPPQAGLLYLTPVFQPGIPLQPPICETNPIPTRPKCETNPIYSTALVPLASCRLFHPLLWETNPIYPPPCHLASFPTPHSAKRTQLSRPRPQIPPYRESTNYQLRTTNQKMRNKPNLPHHPVPLASRRLPYPETHKTNPITTQPPIYELPTTNYEPKNTKRTQFHPPSCLLPRASITRNKPNPIR